MAVVIEANVPPPTWPKRGVTSRYVAMCDVLGFTNLLETRGLRWINDRFNDLAKELRTTFRWEVRAVSFSDTVLLYSIPFPVPPWRDIWQMSALSWTTAFYRYTCHLINKGLSEGLPLRAGIAFGPCVINRRSGIYVGQPIVDAFRVEQSQEWVGVALHESAVDVLRANHAWHLLRGEVTRYDVPLTNKSSFPRLDWTLDWPNVPRGAVPEVVSALNAGISRHLGTEYERKWRAAGQFYNRRTSAKRRRKPLISL